MLTEHDEAVRPLPVLPAGDAIVTSDAGATVTASDRGHSRLARAMRIEWLGQTVASLCWIASVFTYGIGSSGDWLQLCAASAWLVANIASIASAEDE